MSTEEDKLAKSKTRVNEAVEKILSADPNYAGDFVLECHCHDGIVKDVFEVRSRRKV